MALWVNLLKQSARIDASSTPWKAPTFTITQVPSVLPGQRAYRHQNDGVQSSRNRRQTLGTLSGALETLIVVLENVDATVSDIANRDIALPGMVSRAQLSWGPGTVANVVAPAGSQTAAGLVDLGTGPNGGPTYAIISQGLPDTPGNGREIYVYPSGTGTNTESCILHYAGLHEADTFSPALLVTGADTQEFEVLDLDDWPVVIRGDAPRHVSLATHRPRASGRMGSTTRGPRTTRRIWPLSTDLLTTDEADELYAMLEPGLPVVAVGALIHDTPFVGITCRPNPEALRRRAGPLTGTWYVDFELQEHRALAEAA